MTKVAACSLLLVYALCVLPSALGQEDVATFLFNYNATAEEKFYSSVVADWEYNTDINAETQQISNQKNKEVSEWQSGQAKEAALLDVSGATDEEKRLVNKIKKQGTGALSSEDFDRLQTAIGNMQNAYSTAKVCDLPGHSSECLPLDPDLTEIMSTSRDYNLLREVWKGWRDEAGKTARSDFKTYVELENKAAVLNGYKDASESWLAAYETEGIEEQFEELWQGILPLYEELHAFARRKLYNKYGAEVINLEGPIPAHLMGNMWAQDWLSIYDLVEPYSGKVRPDATPGILEKGWDARKLFNVSDEFFTGLGLIPMPQEFWDETMYVKPEGKEVVCHASAWDFYNRKDFRIKMCTVLNQRDFVTIHHEMGHIQYFLQYANQPVSFREGANPGFHEAVGDTLALSVGTLDHLYKLGLIAEPDNDAESDINYLMSMALDKLAFIPFGYLMDKWRWDVFSGRVNERNWNEAWWSYRTRYQGLAPPLDRTEEDFDPASKFHISNNVPYIRYFVSYIVQFQFYETMCTASGHTGPLYKCDFDGSTEAGAKLGDMLSLGSSQIWEDALEQVTGTRLMDSSSLVRYFQPLLDFLKEENRKNGDTVGWPDYSFQPPTNTVVGENGKVELDTAGGGSSTCSPSSVVLLLSLLFVFLTK